MDDDQGSYSLVTPFWIDTDTYTDRDRSMFVAGAEFESILRHVRFEDGSLETTIHRENESRVRMLCGRFGRTCTITACEPEHDPNGTWSYLEIAPRTPG